MDAEDIKRIIEALLFVADKPLTVDQIADVTQSEKKDIQAALGAVAADCEEKQRGFRLKAMAGGRAEFYRMDNSSFRVVARDL